MTKHLSLAALLGTVFMASTIDAAANTTVSDPPLLRRCINNPAGPLLNPPPPAERVCNVPFDQLPPDAHKIRHPWTHETVCAPSSAVEGIQSLICAYTKDDFRGEHGLIMLTASTIAADAARLLDDVDPRLSKMPYRGDPPRYPPYRIVDMGDKGLGIVANASIPEGAIIMRDTPVMLRLVDRPESLTKKDTLQLINTAMNNLPLQERLEILDLARTIGGHPVEDILRTNAFQVRFNGSPHHGLFKELARVNHACKPNAFTRWSQSKLEMDVVAYRDIRPGEEITVSYTPLNMLTEERANALLSHWSIKCQCPVCASESEIYISDMQRRQLDRILEELDLPDVRTPQLVASLVEELEEIIDAEGLAADRGDIYGVVSRVYQEMGDYPTALRYADIGSKLQEQYKGWDDRRTWNAKRFVEYLKMRIRMNEQEKN